MAKIKSRRQKFNEGLEDVKKFSAVLSELITELKEHLKGLDPEDKKWNEKSLSLHELMEWMCDTDDAVDKVIMAGEETVAHFPNCYW